MKLFCLPSKQLAFCYKSIRRDKHFKYYCISAQAQEKVITFDFRSLNAKVLCQILAVILDGF